MQNRHNQARLLTLFVIALLTAASAAAQTPNGQTPLVVHSVIVRSRAISARPRAASVRRRRAASFGPAAPQPPGRRASSASASAATRYVAAQVVSVNVSASGLRLRVATGDLPLGSASEFDAVLDMTAVLMKANRPATLADFAPGDLVEAHLTRRTSPDTVVVVRELYDGVSYTTRQNETKAPCVGIVARFTETELDVRTADTLVHRFHVSDKTRLIKGDAPAHLSDFPDGSPVAVKGKRQPSGDLAASIVGADAAGVTWAYRDTLATWNGVVATVEGNEQVGATVSLRRDDGAARRFFLAAGAPFAQGSVRLPWSSLPNATVRVHLVKGVLPSGMRDSDMVRVAKPRKASVGVAVADGMP